MESGLLANKAKTARRVIEILEYFDDHKRQATVMDIARRYGAPQSSTSELLAILVEMGLLYKDTASRCYSPTPRAAMLGSLYQPSPVRDGRLSMLTDRLVAQTGLSTVLMGMVGLNVQVFRWMAGNKPLATTVPQGLFSGHQVRLCDSASGWLLLSQIAPQRCEGMLRRLRAESGSDNKFDVSEMLDHVRACDKEGYAFGPSGFGANAQMCAVLIPHEADERPMALGFVYEPSSEIDPNLLATLLRKSVQSCASQPANFVSLRGAESESAISVVA
jgi:DNA-binding IclR family transcriptional regulator